MSDTSGPSSLTPLAFYDPESSVWRMSAATFPWEPPPSLETLPASGMTLDGVLYELPTSAPAIAVPASSSLPTPTVGDSKSARNSTANRSRIPPTGVHAGDTLTDWATLLPTPTTEPMTGNGDARNLGKEIALLPTPAANEYDHSDVDAYLARRERCKETAQNGNGFGLVLSMAVKMLPTPRTSDANGTGAHGDGGQDLRTTVDKMLPTPTARDHKGHNQRRDETCLTGALTAPPSPDTPACSDDPPLTLWTDEAD